MERHFATHWGKKLVPKYLLRLHDQKGDGEVEGTWYYLRNIGYVQYSVMKTPYIITIFMTNKITVEENWSSWT